MFYLYMGIVERRRRRRRVCVCVIFHAGHPTQGFADALLSSSAAAAHLEGVMGKPWRCKERKKMEKKEL